MDKDLMTNKKVIGSLFYLCKKLILLKDLKQHPQNMFEHI
ncbi:hypothetical protein BI355_1077 [Companilactobacillus crustorum]|nr:hypothetical protein BI355_1077 [Companilactobacillus crustorum]